MDWPSRETMDWLLAAMCTIFREGPTDSSLDHPGFVPGLSINATGKGVRFSQYTADGCGFGSEATSSKRRHGPTGRCHQESTKAQGFLKTSILGGISAVTLGPGAHARSSRFLIRIFSNNLRSSPLVSLICSGPGRDPEPLLNYLLD